MSRRQQKQEEVEVEEEEEEEEVEQQDEDDDEEEQEEEEEDEDDDPVGDVAREFVASVRAAGFVPKFDPTKPANWEPVLNEFEAFLLRQFYHQTGKH